MDYDIFALSGSLFQVAQKTSRFRGRYFWEKD
jgi:hypothetical protein